jgi:hypothetical protein
MSLWNRRHLGIALIALLAAAPSCGELTDEDIEAEGETQTDAVDDIETVVSAAIPGTTSTAVPFGSMNFYAGGVLRAQLRNGVATWYKDRVDGAMWVTVTSQIRDHSTDGYCAKVRYLGDTTWYGTECDAVWRTRTGTIGWGGCSGCEFIEVILYRDYSNRNQYTGTGNAYKKVIAPPGF